MEVHGTLTHKTGNQGNGKHYKSDADGECDFEDLETHFHDDRYYSEDEMDTFLAGKAAASHGHTLSDISDSGTAAAKNVPSSGDAAADECTLGNDSRLSDARTPTSHFHDDRYYSETETDALLAGKAAASHSHTLSDVTDSGTAAALNVPASGDAASGEVVKGDDSRLTDPRTAIAHFHDDRYYTESEMDTKLAAKAASSHTHTLANITDSGTAAAKDVPASGDAASNECVLGSDSRLGAGGAVEVPVGGVIPYISSISGASYPSGNFAKCEGGSYPDLRNKFLRGSATSGSTGGSDTHTHDLSASAVNVTPCGGGGDDVMQLLYATDSASSLPSYYTTIMLVRHA